MAGAAFVRLGPTSAAMSQVLADAEQGPHEPPLVLQCAQVPNEFGVGSIVWLWLGSDNNKGQPTQWTQGIRALGICGAKKALGSGKFEIEIRDLHILSRAIEKQELLQVSPETYAQSLSQAAIVGLNNYSSQVVQLLSSRESATLAALTAKLSPADADFLFGLLPEARDVEVVSRSGLAPQPTDLAGVSPRMELSQLGDDDPVYIQVRTLLLVDRVGGVLLVGPPGTGKSWYARQLALKLVDGAIDLVREVQFHPAYQYEDFVEGYVPDAARGFALTDKHLLVMAAIAKDSDGPVVLVIDEFSRTDPARVLGEAMTYMEDSYRGVEFRLPSGRRASIPKNLMFLATMNPEDRSVEEIDAAMERRWAKVSLAPSIDVLRMFLGANGASPVLTGATAELFQALQPLQQIGHAFFRAVKDRESLHRLWETQIYPSFVRKYRFDSDSLAEVDRLWARCTAKLDAIAVDDETEGTGNAPEGERPAENATEES